MAQVNTRRDSPKLGVQVREVVFTTFKTPRIECDGGPEVSAILMKADLKFIDHDTPEERPTILTDPYSSIERLPIFGVEARPKDFEIRCNPNSNGIRGKKVPCRDLAPGDSVAKIGGMVHLVLKMQVVVTDRLKHDKNCEMLTAVFRPCIAPPWIRWVAPVLSAFFDFFAGAPPLSLHSILLNPPSSNPVLAFPYNTSKGMSSSDSSPESIALNGESPGVSPVGCDDDVVSGQGRGRGTSLSVCSSNGINRRSLWLFSTWRISRSAQ